MPRKSRRSIEGAIQTAIMLHVATRGRPDVFAFHVPNGGSRRSVIEGAILKRQGVIAGVPDLCILIDGSARFLEVKAPGGKLSAAQVQTMEKMRRAGAVIAVAVGLDDALAVLKQWGAFRDDTWTTIGDAATRTVGQMHVAREIAR